MKIEENIEVPGGGGACWSGIISSPEPKAQR